MASSHGVAHDIGPCLAPVAHRPRTPLKSPHSPESTKPVHACPGTHKRLATQCPCAPEICSRTSSRSVFTLAGRGRSHHRCGTPLILPTPLACSSLGVERCYMYNVAYRREPQKRTTPFIGVLRGGGSPERIPPTGERRDDAENTPRKQM